MSDDYQKFGSNPPIHPQPNNPNPVSYPYNQQYYPPNQQYYPPDQQNLQQNPQNYQIPPNPNNNANLQYNQNPQNYQNQPYNPIYQNQNVVVVQPGYPANPVYPANQYQPNFHSALVCLQTLLVITIIYQVWMLFFFGINAQILQFPVNVVWGLIFAVTDCLDLIVSFFLFQSSKIHKTYCKKGMIFFWVSLLFFIMTYSITFSVTYYETNDGLYYYNVPLIWLVFQALLRFADLVAVSSYNYKRNLAA